MFKRIKLVVVAVAVLALCFTLSQNLYAATVGGTSTGFLNIKKIECKNKTTKQKVRVTPAEDGAWDCEKAGLIVNAGDVIKMVWNMATNRLHSSKMITREKRSNN